MELNWCGSVSCGFIECSLLLMISFDRVNTALLPSLIKLGNSDQIDITVVLSSFENYTAYFHIGKMPIYLWEKI